MIKILQDRATPTISFKHFYKTDTLIGTGTYKFRLYSQSEPVVTPQLATPTNVAIDGTTLSWDAVEDATSYDIYAGDTLIGNTDGGGSSMPNKGDIITIDSKQYRVLKVNGTVAEVLAMYDSATSQAFNASGNSNVYAGADIDTYCNDTFYGGLSASIKSAIVDKTFTQDSWLKRSSIPTEEHYTGTYESGNYYLSLSNIAYSMSITRHCYCLSIQDVLDYLDATTSMGTSDTTLTDTNIWQMFWDATTSQSEYIWLRSAYASSIDYAFRVGSYVGILVYDSVDSIGVVRPAFQVDLSKVEWGQQLIDISNVSFNDSNLPTLLIANNLSVLPSDLYKSGMLNVFDNYNSMSLIEIYDSMNYASWDELPDYQKEMEPFVPYDENSEDFDPPVTAEDNIIYLSQYDKLSNRCLVYYNDSGTGSVAIDGELAVTITSDCLQNKTIADVICAVIDIETYEVKFFEFDSITNNTGVVTITSFGMYFIIDKII